MSVLHTLGRLLDSHRSASNLQCRYIFVAFQIYKPSHTSLEPEPPKVQPTNAQVDSTTQAVLIYRWVDPNVPAFFRVCRCTRA